MQNPKTRQVTVAVQETTTITKFVTVVLHGEFINERLGKEFTDVDLADIAGDQAVAILEFERDNKKMDWKERDKAIESMGHRGTNTVQAPNDLSVTFDVGVIIDNTTGSPLGATLKREGK